VVAAGGTAIAFDAGGAAGISDVPIDVGSRVVEVSDVPTRGCGALGFAPRGGSDATDMTGAAISAALGAGPL